MCDEADAKVNEPNKSVSFMAYVESLPHRGDEIEIEDGKKFYVRQVFHKTIRLGETQFASFMPNIYATRIGEGQISFT